VSTLQPTVVINRQVVWMAGPPRNGRPSAGRRELPCIHSCELPEGLTFEQDLIDLGWHQKEFQRRRSFAYTVVTPSESEVTGCVYINPTPKRGYDAVIFLWARQSELKGGLETRLYAAVREWVAKEWPFKKVAYPGRDIDWNTWQSIPDEKR